MSIGEGYQIVPIPQQVAAVGGDVEKLLNAAGNADLAGYRAQRALTDMRSKPHNITFGLAVDTTRSMESALREITQAMTLMMNGLTSNITPQMAEAFGGMQNIRVGGVVTRFGDFAHDGRKSLRWDPVPYTAINQSNPFDAPLQRVKPDCDGGEEGKGESLLEALLTTLGIEPDRNNDHGSAVQSIVDELDVFHELDRMLGKASDSKNSDWPSAKYNNIRDMYKRPDHIIAVTDDIPIYGTHVLLDSKEVHPSVSIHNDGRVYAMYFQNRGYSSGYYSTYEVESPHEDGPYIDWGVLSAALAGLARLPNIDIYTPPSIQTPQFNGYHPIDLSLEKHYMDASAANGNIFKWHPLTELERLRYGTPLLADKFAATVTGQLGDIVRGFLPEPKMG